MKIEHINLRRLPIVLRPDPTRVLVRQFLPAIEQFDNHRSGSSRIARFMDRVLTMNQGKVEDELTEVMRDFGGRPGLFNAADLAALSPPCRP